MLYLLMLKRYLFILLKTLVFIIFLSLYYFFYLLIFLKNQNIKSFFIEALKNYGVLIIYLIPFILILSFFIFSSSLINNEKKNNFIIIPIISLPNSIILLIYLLLNFELMQIPDDIDIIRKINIINGYINPIGNSKFYANYPIKKYNSLLFYDDKIFFINNIIIKNTNVILSSDMSLNGTKLYKNDSSITFNYISKTIKLNNTKVSEFIIKKVITFLKKTKSDLNLIYKKVNVFVLFLSILLITAGLSYFITGISIYFYDEFIKIINLSALFVFSLFILIIFPSIMSLFNIIKISLVFPSLNVLIPSIIISLVIAIIGYGLIELRYLLLKKY